MSQFARRQYADAGITPFARPMHPKFQGGLALADPIADDVLRHQRSRRSVDQIVTPPPTAKRLPGSYHYGGPMMYPFGHFMAETLHRVLPSLQAAPSLPWLFAGMAGGDANLQNAPAFVHEAFHVLGVPLDRILIVNEPTVVEDLHVCEQGSDLGAGPKAPYLALLGPHTAHWLEAHGPKLESHPRVYVSRTAFRSGRLLGESVLEAALKSVGFHIFKPEDHSLIVQLQTYRQAQVLIFAEGSACHGTELLGRDLRTVALINRRGSHQLARMEHVLQPRAESFRVFRGNQFVGGLVANKQGQDTKHNGVSLIDVRGLLSFLRREELANLPATAFKDYVDVARRDLADYEDWARQSGALKGEAHEAARTALQQRFLEIRKKLVNRGPATCPGASQPVPAGAVTDTPPSPTPPSVPARKRPLAPITAGRFAGLATWARRWLAGPGSS